MRTRYEEEWDAYSRRWDELARRSGAGWLTELLLDDCRELIALDVSAEMLERLRARFGTRPELHLLKGSGVDLAPIPDGSIDAVASYDVFVHLEHEDVYLVEIARVLASRGGGSSTSRTCCRRPGSRSSPPSTATTLGGRRTPGKFSCLSVPVMRHFVESLGFQVRAVGTQHFGGVATRFIAFEKACD